MRELFKSMFDILKTMPSSIFDFLCFWFPFLEVFKKDD